MANYLPRNHQEVFVKWHKSGPLLRHRNHHLTEAGGVGCDLKIHRFTEHLKSLISSHYVLVPIQLVFQQLLQKPPLL